MTERRLSELADLITPMAIRVAATLRLADHIVGGATSLDALADRMGVRPDGLGRLLRHLVTVGVLQEPAPGTYGLTDLGAELHEDDPGGQGAWLDIGGAVGRADLAVVHLLEALHTGEPAYPLMYGCGFWEDLEADPGLSASFDALVGSQLTAEAEALAAGCDWGSATHVVDVGGGNGALLAAILRAHPQLHGTLVELPGPAASAERTFAEAGFPTVAGGRPGASSSPSRQARTSTCCPV